MIFVALSFCVLDSEGYLWRDCYSNLIVKRLASDSTNCLLTDCEVYCLNFFRMLKCKWELFSISDIWLFRVKFSSIVKPKSFYSVTLSSSVLLQQICNCSSISLCCTDSCFDVMSISSVLPVLNTRLVSIDHFSIGVRYFSSSFIHVPILFILHLRYAVIMQLLFSVMLGMSALQIG